MSTAYIYDIDTNEILQIIEGRTNNEVEAIIADINLDNDTHGVSYSSFGLIETKSTHRE